MNKPVSNHNHLSSLHEEFCLRNFFTIPEIIDSQTGVRGLARNHFTHLSRSRIMQPNLFHVPYFINYPPILGNTQMLTCCNQEVVDVTNVECLPVHGNRVVLL